MPSHLMTPNGSLSIRPAMPADATAVRALRLEALAGHPQAFAADYALSEAESAERWTERIASYAEQETGILCLAAAENHVIGMAGLVRGNWPKTRHAGIFWGVYVRPEWRGCHIAEALIEEAVDWARAKGLALVKLGVIASNTAAIRCYGRCGFSVYGIDPQVITWEGAFYDELLMARPL